MDTKLKRFSWVLKALMYLLVVISFGYILVFGSRFAFLIEQHGNWLFSKDYISSDNTAWDIYHWTSGLLNLKSEEYLKSEQYAEMLAREIVNANRGTEQPDEVLAIIDGSVEFQVQPEVSPEASPAPLEMQDLSEMPDTADPQNTQIEMISEQPGVKVDSKQGFIKVLNVGQIIVTEQEKREVEQRVKQHLQDFRDLKLMLSNVIGIYYYANDGENVFTNCDMTTADEFKQYKYYMVANAIGGYQHSTINYYGYNPEFTLYIAYDDSFVRGKQAEFEQYKKMINSILVSLSIALVLGLSALIYLIYAAGKRPDRQLRLLAIDRLWTDVNIILIISTILLCVLICAGVFYNIDFWLDGTLIISAVISVVLCSAGLALFLSLVRHIRNKTFIKHSLTYVVLNGIRTKIANILKTLFNRTPLNLKIAAAILVAETATCFFVLLMEHSSLPLFFFIALLFVTALILYLVFRYVLKPYDDEVQAGLQVSISNSLRAERMKTELITNVSHDLKTPLTAIINYAGLLLKQNQDSEYAQVIYEKSLKLQRLTEDLFDVSKAQSGNITADIQGLDAAELVRQTLAEFEGVSIDFKLNLQSVKILADGKLMSRVLENLIVNIVKYSLPDTRAYIDVFESNGKAFLVFKNIANYEMNFDNEEITERFWRGDAARTTDGNGLGLAIAKSYTEICGGTLAINIDGDLFKVTITF